MYPPPPWHLHGQAWLSVFRATRDGRVDRSPGLHVVALVRYEEPSPLTYAELVVARPVARPTRGATIEQIWVDSLASIAGGRELWAIPKDMADFDERPERGGLVHHTQWQVSADGAPVLRARFTDTSVAPRLPFRGSIRQPGLDDGPRTARVSGSARVAPCRSRWDIAPDGPLGWLAGHRPVTSLRLRDFRMSFA